MTSWRRLRRRVRTPEPERVRVDLVEKLQGARAERLKLEQRWLQDFDVVGRQVARRLKANDHDFEVVRHLAQNLEERRQRAFERGHTVFETTLVWHGRTLLHVSIGVKPPFELKDGAA